MEHDPRFEGLDDEKLVADVKEYGWHVVKILEKDETPGWAFRWAFTKTSIIPRSLCSVSMMRLLTFS